MACVCGSKKIKTKQLQKDTIRIRWTHLWEVTIIL